ncbi:MAG: hypothetical protein ACPGTQ_03645 [Colwellia sp.]
MLTKFKPVSSSKKKRSIIILLIIVVALIIWQVIYSKSFNSVQITKSPSDNKAYIPEVEQQKPQGKLISPQKTTASNPQANIKKSHIESLGTFDCLENILSFGDEITEDYQQSVDEFLKSGDPLYYALFGPTSEEKSRFDLLYDYNKIYPNNPLVSNDLINNCSESNNKCTPEFIEELIQADANNGAAWVNVVSFYASKNNDEKVLDSINALEKTAYYNERFGERALLYAQALEGSPSNNFSVNAVAGIGIGVSHLFSFTSVSEWCQSNISISLRAQACLTFGEQLETRSQTAISYAYGLAIQSTIYTKTNNTKAQKIIKSKEQNHTESLRNEAFQTVGLMMILDERLMRRYLNSIDSEGEIGSQELLIEEAEKLYEENDNYLCTLMNEALGSIL